MKAVELTAWGPPDNFRIVDIPVPKPGPGEALVNVHHAGMRWSEMGYRQAGKTLPPYIFGHEIAGVVAEVGEGVSQVKVGDRVYGKPDNGGYAEYCRIPAARLAKIPDGVGTDEILVYIVNMVTAYLAVCEWAKVQDGETVLLHGASGGVGRLIVQICRRKFRDVTIIGVAGSDEKCASVIANGADHCINRKTHDYVAEVMRITGGTKQQGGGVHVAFNGVAGDTHKTDLSVIRKLGRWVLYGSQGGVGTFDLYPYVYDSITVMVFSMLSFPGTPAMDRCDAFLADWLKTEKLDKPTVVPIEDIVETTRAFEAGLTQGKIVYKI